MAAEFRPERWPRASYPDSAGAQRLPGLDLATHGAKLAQERLCFPLRSQQDLLPLFDHGALCLPHARLPLDEVLACLPASVFPIESSLDFLGKALVGLLSLALPEPEDGLDGEGADFSSPRPATLPLA